MGMMGGITTVGVHVNMLACRDIFNIHRTSRFGFVIVLTSGHQIHLSMFSGDSFSWVLIRASLRLWGGAATEMDKSCEKEDTESLMESDW